MVDGDFNWLQKILIGNMTSSTITLTPDEIIQCLELKAQEARHRDFTKEGEKLLATKQKKAKGQQSSMKCMHCHCSGHAIKKCWEEGGGGVGQAPEWWKLARDRKDGQKGKQMRKGQAHAAIAKNSSDSGSESCALLSDSPECSIDWTNMLAPTTNSNTTSFTPPYLLNSVPQVTVLHTMRISFS